MAKQRKIKVGANQAPTVTVKQDCQVYWQGHMLELKSGQVVDGPLAVFLAATGAPVEVNEPVEVNDGEMSADGAGGESE